MVILTDTSFARCLEPFIRWKTMKGIRVETLFKGASFAGENYQSIKTTLSDLYNSSSPENPPPEYLLIAGDVNKVPYYGGADNITDMYYGEYDGNNDYLPELFIGRLPVADTNELKNILSRIISYEKCEFADTNKFYSNALATAGRDAVHYPVLNGQVRYGVENYLTTANGIKEYHYYSEDISGTTKNQIINLINNGVSLINYTGHGLASGWLIKSTSPDTANFYVSDFGRLVNKDRYPFVIANACYTSRFNTSSFGNKMVISGSAGAIGYIGCSNESFFDEDFYWAVGTGTPSANPTYATTGLGALDRLFHTHGESPSDWYNTMGQVVYGGNLSVSASTSPLKKYYWETYNLVGDPSLIPVIGTPDTFKINLPDTLPRYIRSYSFISDPFSYIALSRSDTLREASHASPSGSISLDMNGLSDGDSCLLVITGQDKVPLIKTIYFADIDGEFINLAGTEIDDTGGNNNNQADFGETISLDLTISNLGSTDATNLTAAISTTSGLVTITNDSVTFPSLTAGDSVITAGDLSLSVAGDIPDNEIVTIDLVLKDDLVEKRYKIDILLHAPVVDIISMSVDDSETGNNNRAAEPGETVKLIFRVENQGSSNTSGTLSISNLTPGITLLEASKSSGLIEHDKSTDIALTGQVSTEAAFGSTIIINSLLDCNPFIVSRDFDFRVGRIRESFEAASFKVFPWINASSKPWIITSSDVLDGSLAARSGSIPDNASSSLAIIAYYEAADSLVFHYKVSSEKNYDFLIFRINNTEVLRKSGEIPWQRVKFPLPRGLNKMEWVYKKDQNTSSGLDLAMIDKIDFSGTTPVTYIQKDIVAARAVSPSTVNKDPGIEPVIIKLLNNGPDTISGFNLAYSVNNGSPVRQYFNEKIIPFGDSLTVTFNSKADLSRFGEYNITMYSYDNEDDYLFNDTLRVSISNDNFDGHLAVSPNPFTDKIELVINSRFNAIARVSLSGYNGKKIMDFSQRVSAGINKGILIGEPRMPVGLYFITVKLPGVTETVPVVKIH
jgi:hypothetical protein